MNNVNERQVAFICKGCAKFEITCQGAEAHFTGCIYYVSKKMCVHYKSYARCSRDNRGCIYGNGIARDKICSFHQAVRFEASEFGVAGHYEAQEQ